MSNPVGDKNIFFNLCFDNKMLRYPCIFANFVRLRDKKINLKLSDFKCLNVSYLDNHSFLLQLILYPL